MQGDKLHQFLMPYSLYRELQKRCKTSGVSAAEIIRQAIKAFLENQSEKKPEVGDDR